MGTRPRNVRVPDDTWDAAVAKARREGTTVTAVVLAALNAFLAAPAPVPS